MTKKDLFMYDTLRSLGAMLLGIAGGLVLAEIIKEVRIFSYIFSILFGIVGIINSMTYARKHKEFRKSLK